MEAHEPQDELKPVDETTPAKRSLVARLTAPLRKVLAPLTLLIALVKKVVAPLRRLAPLFRPIVSIGRMAVGLCKKIFAPLGKLLGPLGKVLAPLGRLSIVFKPIKPLWAFVEGRVRTSQRWRIGAIVVVALVLISVEVGVRGWLMENDAQQGSASSAATALEALDQGKFDEAKKSADEVRQRNLNAAQRGATAYVLGCIAARDAEGVEGKRQRALYAIAAQHLQQARESGLPAYRRGNGLFVLGKSLQGSGQMTASRSVLEEALKADAERATEIHRLLAEAFRQGEPADLQAALDHCDEYLADTALMTADRHEGLLLRARILFDLGKLAECGQTLDQIPLTAKVHSAVLLLRSRMLIYEARGLNEGRVAANMTVSAEARAKYQEAMEMLRQAQGRGQQELQATRESSYLIGLCLLELHETAAAQDQFSRTAKMYLEFDEGTAAALYEADMLRAAGQDEEAVAAYTRSVGAAGVAATYRNAWLSLEEFRNRLIAAYEVYSETKQYQRAVQMADLAEPILSRERRVPMAAQAHRDWARLLLAHAENQSLKEKDAAERQARDQLRLAGKEFLQAARLRLPTRQYPNDLWEAGQCFLDGRDYVRAILAIDEYLAVEPRQRRPLALLGLGESRLALGQPEKAWEALNECLTTFPTDAASYRARLLAAKTFIERDQCDKAEDLLRENLNGDALTPASSEWRESLYALGKLLHLIGRHDEAIQALDEAVARYPDAAEAIEARYLLAESYRLAAQKPREKLQSDTIESARIAHARQMQQLLGLAVAQYEAVQDVLIRREEQTELTALEQAILRNCCFLRGAALFDGGRFEDAIRAYSMATNRYQHDPEVLGAYMQIASCYQRMNRQEETRGTLEQAKMVLKRIKDDAPFAKVTNYDRQEWSGWIDWMLRMEQQGPNGRRAAGSVQ